MTGCVCEKDDLAKVGKQGYHADSDCRHTKQPLTFHNVYSHIRSEACQRGSCRTNPQKYQEKCPVRYKKGAPVYFHAFTVFTTHLLLPHPRSAFSEKATSCQTAMDGVLSHPANMTVNVMKGERLFRMATIRICMVPLFPDFCKVVFFTHAPSHIPPFLWLLKPFFCTCLLPFLCDNQHSQIVLLCGFQICAWLWSTTNIGDFGLRPTWQLRRAPLRPHAWSPAQTDTTT